MKTEYKDIIMGEGKKAISFNIITRKGEASGLFSENRIFVHHIKGNNCVKGIMQVLINKFKVNKITFTPLINDNIKNSICGTIKICKANDPNNPYGEDFEYIECDWGSNQF